LGIVLYLWQLTVPRFLQFYDSGVYMAAAMHLVSGALPYRDFTIVQPPGILYLLMPEALLGRIFGTHDAFLVARLVSALVTAFDATLLAWLVRSRGRSAMLVAGVGLVLMPVAIFFSSAVRLEPYCICFILLGALVALTSRGGPSRVSTPRLVAAGALFGAAATVEFWAFYPFLAMVFCLAPRVRRRTLAFVGGAAASVTALTAPFLVSTPGRFLSMVFFDQLQRKSNGSTGGESLIWRLIDMTGFSATSISPNGTEAVIAFMALGLLVVAAARVRVSDGAVDSFLAWATILTIGGLMAGPDAFTDFGYFAAPFLLCLVAVSLAKIGGPMRQRLSSIRASHRVRRLATISIGLT
jgi:alpha-1,2-mannosyltransferase